MASIPVRMNLITVALGLLAGCAGFSNTSQPVPIDVAAYLHDELFPAPVSPELLDVDLFLELPENYRQQLDRLVLPLKSEYERYVALRRWMFRTFDNFEFDITETYSLSSLNTQRKINCLSFSVMYVAAARYAGVPADFQLVNAPPYWDVENTSWVNNQHIDVTGVVQLNADSKQDLIPRRNFNTSTFTFNGSKTYSEFFSVENGSDYRYVIDINPAIVSVPLSKRVIDEQQVLSLYYSNKTIEALLDEDEALAYAYTRQALLLDSNSTIAWNNLGVLYARVNALAYAKEAYEVAILLHDSTHSAMSNLARIYNRLGDTERAAQLEAEVSGYREANPYYHQSLADIDLRSGEFAAAIAHLEDAVARKHNEQIFYHELAIAHQQLGNEQAVIDNLTKARRYARGQEKARFSGKLQALQELIEAKLQ